jgi:hypothetical protein
MAFPIEKIANAFPSLRSSKDVATVASVQLATNALPPAVFPNGGSSERSQSSSRRVRKIPDDFDAHAYTIR